KLFALRDQFLCSGQGSYRPRKWPATFVAVCRCAVFIASEHTRDMIVATNVSSAARTSGERLLSTPVTMVLIVLRKFAAGGIDHVSVRTDLRNVIFSHSAISSALSLWPPRPACRNRSGSKRPDPSIIVVDGPGVATSVPDRIEDRPEQRS